MSCLFLYQIKAHVIYIAYNMKDKILSGVSIVAYEKNNIKFGMTCAWFMPCDYDQILLLLGSIPFHSIRSAITLLLMVVSNNRFPYICSGEGLTSL